MKNSILYTLCVIALVVIVWTVCGDVVGEPATAAGRAAETIAFLYLIMYHMANWDLYCGMDRQ